jgi:hypothetical protein
MLAVPSVDGTCLASICSPTRCHSRTFQAVMHMRGMCRSRPSIHRRLIQCNVANAPTLEMVDMSNNALTGTIPHSYSRLTSLKYATTLASPPVAILFVLRV